MTIEFDKDDQTTLLETIDFLEDLGSLYASDLAKDLKVILTKMKELQGEKNAKS